MIKISPICSQWTYSLWVIRAPKLLLRTPKRNQAQLLVGSQNFAAKDSNSFGKSFIIKLFSEERKIGLIWEAFCGKIQVLSTSCNPIILAHRLDTFFVSISVASLERGTKICRAFLIIPLFGSWNNNDKTVSSGFLIIEKCSNYLDWIRTPSSTIEQEL